jgi:DNA-binding MarR family transcriptional regulator
MRFKTNNDWPKRLIGVNKLVHEPARFVILNYLDAAEQVDFIFLLNETGLTQGNLSSHISRLEQAGFLEIHKSFVRKRPRTTFTITHKGRLALQEYLVLMKSFYCDFIK